MVALVAVAVAAGLWFGAGRAPAPRRFHDRQAELGGLSSIALLRVGVGCGSVGSVVVGWPGVGVWWLLVALVGWRRVRHRRERMAVAERADALATLVGALSVAVRAGRPLGAAVVDAADVSPVGSAVAQRVRAGWPVVDALDEVVGSDGEDERLVCVTVRALEATGASGSDALERLVEALGERRSGRQEARTQAQQALSSSLVLSVLPLVFGMAVAVIEPAVAELYAVSWSGAGCVGVAGMLSLAGWEWQQRLLGSVVA